MMGGHSTDLLVIALITGVAYQLVQAYLSGASTCVFHCNRRPAQPPLLPSRWAPRLGPARELTVCGTERESRWLPARPNRRLCYFGCLARRHKMPVQASESIVIRTYPFQEGDLIVSFFTRDQGKLRGVAKRARRPKSPFGSGLERLSHVRMYYVQRENRELANLNACELIHSQFGLTGDYSAAVVLDYLAEVAEHLLPPQEPNERFFRLMLAVLDHLRSNPSAGIWPAVHYFSLWAVRLSGLLPELRLQPESLEIAEEIMVRPIGQLTGRSWNASTATDLRRALVRLIQNHAERRLITAPLLETL